MNFPRPPSLVLPLVLCLPFLIAGCAVPLAITAGSYAADGASLAVSEKTTTDHFLSMVSKKDCAMWRLFRGNKICKDRVGDHDPYEVDYNDPYRSSGEDGIQYGAPMHAAPDAPASSWDAATYKTAPAPSRVAFAWPWDKPVKAKTAAR